MMGLSAKPAGPAMRKAIRDEAGSDAEASGMAPLVLAFGVALVVLAFEVLLTRLFSILLSYHFAFAAVAAATFGAGVGGWLAFYRSGHNLSRFLGWSGLLIGISLPAAVYFPALLPAGTPWFAYIVFAAPPFVLCGATLCALFILYPASAPRLYCADLAGAAAGAVLPLIALNYVSPGELVLALALGIMVVGALIAGQSKSRRTSRPRRLLVYASAMVVAGVGLYHASHLLFAVELDAIAPEKGIRSAASKPHDILRTIWNAQSRVDVVDGPAPTRSIFIDGASGSRMFPLVADQLGALAYVRDDLNYLPFDVGPASSVLVIGAGGGREVLMALLAGSTSITAVEVDPGVVEAMQDFGEYNGNLYRNDKVRVIVGEGRAALAREGDQYDLIYLPLVRLESPDLKGLSLVENAVFTREAFSEFREHLLPAGHLAVNVHNDALALRVYLTWIQALADAGVDAKDAARAAAVFANPSLATPQGGAVYPLLILSREPLTAEEGWRMFSSALRRGFEPIYVPHAYEDRFARWVDLSAKTYDRLIGGVPTAILPVTDNRPFFYNLADWPPAPLQNLLAVFCAMAIGLSGVAVLVSRRRRSAAVRPSALAYFALLGIGFMVIEITLLQSAVRLLANPTLAVTVLLSTFLVSAGIGSGLSDIFRSALRGRLVPVLIAVAVAVYLTRLGQAAIGPYVAELGVVGQTTAIAALMAPLGILAGTAFPLGMIYWCLDGDQDISLMWAVNALFSAAGAIGAVAMTMTWGFAASLEAAALIYLAVGLVVLVVEWRNRFLGARHALESRSVRGSHVAIE